MVLIGEFGESEEEKTCKQIQKMHWQFALDGDKIVMQLIKMIMPPPPPMIPSKTICGILWLDQ